MNKITRENVEKTLLVEEKQILKNLRRKEMVSSRVFKNKNGKLFSKIAGVHLFAQMFFILFTTAIAFGSWKSFMEQFNKKGIVPTDYFEWYKYFNYFTAFLFAILLFCSLTLLMYFVRNLILELKEKIVFDKNNNYYLIQQKPRNFKKVLKHKGSIEDVCALQMLQGSKHERKPSRNNKFQFSAMYTHRELNLVLKDGSRINMFDLSDYSRMLISAQKIAKFLDVPIWNEAEDEYEGAFRDLGVSF